jgi:hypothetical protein
MMVSSCLLGKSQTALVGRTLPVETVTKILAMLESQSIVVAVHDVKTEVAGAETVRFKAEIEFNAEQITKNRLMRKNSDPFCHISAEIKSCKDPLAIEDWLMRNDSLFLYALTSEIKHLETIIRHELRQTYGFSNIHIDLEPW